MKTKYVHLLQDRFALSVKRNSADKGVYRLIFLLAILFPHLSNNPWNAYQTNARLSIGQIQGPGQVSPHLNQTVQFQGVVTGIREDQNLQGIRYYTMFMQDLPEFSDSAVSTSDGIAVFLGRKKPTAEAGDVVTVSGSVTEYYGLTEIDDRGLKLSLESRGHPLPKAIELSPPQDIMNAAAYLERLEGMLVKMATGIVVGPTHEGCGFSVVHESVGKSRIMKHTLNADVGQIINILNWTDVDCGEFPSLEVGDEVHGLEGPLTYHFEEYKLIQQRNEQLSIEKPDQIPQEFQLPSIPGELIRVATFNLHNYFDSDSDTGDLAEPVIPPNELALKQTKLSYAIANILQCPAILAVQEVEESALLRDLAGRLAADCDFTYTISHLDSADLRGADVALLSDPRFAHVTSLEQHQSCTNIETGIVDSTADCPDGSEPLFSRQPLQIEMEIDQIPVSIIVVHFKSKRGGETETEPRRLAQAEVITQIVKRLLSDSPAQSVIVMGDFNDYYQSPVMTNLRAYDLLTDPFDLLPENQRYSYIFDGASQLIDGILVSQNLVDDLVQTHIFHINADYPISYASAVDDNRIGLRSSDHDIPMIALQLNNEENTDRERTEPHKPTPIEVDDETIEVEVKPKVPVIMSTLTFPPTREPRPLDLSSIEDTSSEHMEELTIPNQIRAQWQTVLALVFGVLMIVGVWLARRMYQIGKR